MRRTEVESSNIKTIGYDKDERVLEVTFLKGGVYFYLGVQPDIYRGFMEAESHGKFFHRNIKGVYECLKMTAQKEDVEFDAQVIANFYKENPLPMSMLCEQNGWDYEDVSHFFWWRELWLRMQPVEYIHDVIRRVQELTGFVNFAYANIQKKVKGDKNV